MATASVSDTPNPNAKKFTLDTRLPTAMNFRKAEDAAGNKFAAAVFAIPGVVQVFGVMNGDFVTVNRAAGADWDPIVDGVKAACAEHL